MIENYQDEMALEPMEPQEASFATIAAIEDAGVQLQFDGCEEPSRKLYLTNAFAVFKTGERVRVIKDSGTYVVEYPVGPPRKTMEADHADVAEVAAQAGSALTAQSADTAKNAQKSDTAVYCQNGHNGSMLGFFGTTPKGRYSASAHSFNMQYCPSSGTLETVINYHNKLAVSHDNLVDKYNQLISALDYRGYGLIG